MEGGGRGRGIGGHEGLHGGDGVGGGCRFVVVPRPLPDWLVLVLVGVVDIPLGGLYPIGLIVVILVVGSGVRAFVVVAAVGAIDIVIISHDVTKNLENQLLNLSGQNMMTLMLALRTMLKPNTGLMHHAHNKATCTHVTG